MKKRISLLLFGLFFLQGIAKTQIEISKEKRIDAIFDQWNNLEQPGVAVTVLNDGKLVYQKGFGLANLEYKTPITPSTKFQIGSMSKQFTVFALLLLEAEGKISLNDEVKKYVPEVPDFGKKITLRHLINQTSGLYDSWAIKDLAGWGHNDVFTSQQAIKLMSQQKRLSFLPGTEFAFVNTGFMLIAKVIEKVTGQTFVEYTQKNIFTPLQMANTFFYDDYKIRVENTAMPYQINGKSYKNNIVNHAIAGPTNLYTSVEDMGKWVFNFQNPKVGNTSMMKMLDTPAQLQNGKVWNSSLGILTLGQEYIHKERGIPKIYQIGYAGGFDSAIFRFPRQGFTAIVMSNGGLGYNGNLAMQIANIFMEDIYTEPEQIDFSNLKTRRISNKKLENYCGYYWNEASTYTRRIYLKNDTLRYFRVGYNRESPIVPLDENIFQMLGTWDTKLIIEFDNKGNKKSMLVTVDECDPAVSEMYIPANYSNEELSAYAGVFYCDELGISYKFVIQDEKLVAKNLRISDTTFRPISQDKFSGDKWFFGSIQFERADKKEVKGFYLNMNRVKNLWFSKLH